MLVLRGRRPSSRARAATRSSRPCGMLVLHQAPPEVGTSVTWSPGWSPVARNSVTASRAAPILSGAMWTLSNTMTKVREGGGGAGARLVETRDVLGRAASRDSGIATASKLVMVCGPPSSSTRKSSAVNPPTGLPRRSSTTASTTTPSTCAGKEDPGGTWDRGDS